ncbi:MAG TPA: sterol desaturase family protein [Microvirga sp.]|nr:sterol desaturase family protein [Microvirga sp.]
MNLFDWKGFLLLLVIFAPLERLIALHPEQKLFRKGWWNDLIYVAVNGWFIKAGTLTVVVLGVVAARALIPPSWQEAVAAQPWWLQLAEVLVIADAGFYLMHHAFHAVPWLWQFHAVHHSIEELDWLAAHRVHPVDQILTKGASIMPCFALGFSDAALAAYAFVYHWHAILLHSNVRLPFGPLRWLVASPEFHHWHHGNHPETYDKNFAGQLALLDVLFGTAHITRGEVPTLYGCDDPVPATYWGQLAYPFRRWLSGARRAAGAPAVEPAE